MQPKHFMYFMFFSWYFYVLCDFLLDVYSSTEKNASLQLYSFIFELLANTFEIELSSKLHSFLYSEFNV